MTNEESVALLQRWRDHGDEAAVAELFDRYYRRLVALANSRLWPALAQGRWQRHRPVRLEQPVRPRPRRPHPGGARRRPVAIARHHHAAETGPPD